MRVRAAIFDVYGTLLELGPPPADRDERWRALWRAAFGGTPRLDCAAFDREAGAAVERRRAAARRAGIAEPEVYWPEVQEAVVPELGLLDGDAAERWRLGQARLLHTTRLMPGAAPVLAALRSVGVVLGIASNAQPYTLVELGEALRAEGLGPELFAPDLVFWSFGHGFSKPDPHVFGILGARLAARRIEAMDTLMVGDRLDNDVRPALAQGWRAWLLGPMRASGDADVADGAGGWMELGAALGTAPVRSPDPASGDCIQKITTKMRESEDSP